MYYEQSSAVHNRAQTGPRIAAELTGTAMSDKLKDWLSFHEGVDRLLEDLRQGLGQPRIVKVTEHLNRFFKHCKRKPGETINEYLSRRHGYTCGPASHAKALPYYR